MQVYVLVLYAKTLGYEPTSVTAPTATLDVTLSDVSNSTRTIPKQTTFSATVNNDSFQFVTIADTTMTKNGNDIVFNDLVVYEGTFVTQRYTVDSTDADQRFVINDNRIDLRTLSVSVQNSSSDTTTTIFTKATDVTQLNSESLVYWLQEVESGKYQVYFGDGVVSKSISNANIVLLEFVATNKELANGASAFTSTAAIDGETSIIVTTVESAKGGGERETINSIKLNAPLDYASQGRCVTVGDYQLYARKLFPQTKSVQVFGGEDGSFDSSLGVVSTQEFGKVFVSIKSITGNNLTVTQKEQLVTDLKKYNVASITPVIIDPQTTYLILGVRFKFNSSLTTKDRSTLETNVNDVLVSYNKNTLTDFNKMFRHSELSGLIDEIDNSILNNITNVSMGQFIEPTLNVSTGYNLYFNNAFDHPVAGHNAVNGGVVASTGFRVSGDTVNKQFYDDDGNGNLRRYYLIGNTRTYVDNAAGTVDYTGGSIKVNSLIITTIEDVDGAASSKVRFTAVPSSKDIVAVRNQVLDIDFTNTSIIGEVDTVAVGVPGAAANYVSYASTPETDSF